MARLPAPAFVSSTLVRFLVVGGVSYLVNQLALYLLYDHAFAGLNHDGVFDAALLMASAIAVELSILVRFALNDRWTFRDRGTKPLLERFYQFNLSSFASPVISLACVNLLTPQFGVSYLIANSLGILIGLGWNWVWSTRVVWGEGSAEAAEGASRHLPTRVAAETRIAHRHGT